MSRNKSIVIIPTYNESENIGSLVLRILQDLPYLNVLVVDDNSPDGTAQIVKRLTQQDSRIHLLSRPCKNGLAGAYIAGFDWCMGRGYDHMVQMDADFSHDPSYLPFLLNGLKTHDVAIGARYVQGGGTSGWGLTRTIISRGGNLYAKLVLGMPYQDMTAGFIAWSRKALEAIDYRTIRSKGYCFQVELKYRAHSEGLLTREIPIQFANRKHGQSKMKGSIFWEAAFRVLQLKLGSA